MPITLQNAHLELLLDLPEENYHFSRFDWTGKIIQVTYKGRTLTGNERYDQQEDLVSGRGFFNEFGIDAPVGFDDTPRGDWFHKIGIGLLKKEGEAYEFHRPYEVQPAVFKAEASTDHVLISCQSPQANGYAYLLEKRIELLPGGFRVNYHLQNQGEKPLITNEYNHNFLSVDGGLLGRGGRLIFPFDLNPDNFGEIVNPEGLVEMGHRTFSFRGTPEQQFFFSNLSGGKPVKASWRWEDDQSGLGISETGDFETQAINLWGWKQVICPELFIRLELAPGESQRWIRSYEVFELG